MASTKDPKSFLTSLILLTTLFTQLVMAAPTSQQKRQSSVPPFVLKYAPLVWLASNESYYPADLAGFLTHTTPKVNNVTVSGAPSPLTLDNLNALNSLGGPNVHLTSHEGIEANPPWFGGVKPDASGKTEGAVSCPIVVNDHGNGTVDAFYFYFYDYNKGNIVIGIEFGDHVGDWEHNMIRFQNGVPQTVWYSQHSFGEAFTYKAVEKHGDRPIVYCAAGTHASYATTGTHDHTIPDFNLPFGFVEDHCSKGTLWDPTLNAYIYSYDASSQKFTPYDPSYPVGWLYFTGAWGDAQLPDSTSGQIDVFGQRKYVGGPTGPEDKQLNRTNVCPPGPPCVIRPVLTV